MSFRLFLAVAALAAASVSIGHVASAGPSASALSRVSRHSAASPRNAAPQQKTDSDVYNWGESRVGNGWQTLTNPTVVPHLGSISRWTLQTNSRLAISTSGSVYAWGDNFEGGIRYRKYFPANQALFMQIGNVKFRLPQAMRWAMALEWSPVPSGDGNRQPKSPRNWSFPEPARPGPRSDFPQSKLNPQTAAAGDLGLAPRQ